MKILDTMLQFYIMVLFSNLVRIVLMETEHINLREGENLDFQLNPDFEIKNCVFTISNNTEYEIYPNKAQLPQRIYGDANDTISQCSAHIYNVTSAFTGLYTLKVTANNSDNTEITSKYIQVQVPVSIWPKTGMVVYEGQDFFMKLKSPVERMEECHVLYIDTNGEHDVTLTEAGSENFITYWGDGISNGYCGFRAHSVKVEHSGIWHVYTHNSSEYSVISDIFVTVFNDSNEITYSDQKIGSTGVVTNVKETSNIKYCQKVEPEAELNIQEGHCSWIVDIVTDVDERNYTAKFAVSGRMSEIESTNIVSVIEDDKKSYKEVIVNVTSSEREEGAVDLLCRIVANEDSNSENEAQFCRFVTPNGTGILVTDGVGNKKYSHFGTGLNSGKNKDCGLTIHSPTDDDYGMWQCYIYWNSKLRKGFLNVNKGNEEEALLVKTSSNNNLVVINGTNNVKLYCEANAPLRYCWFLHPDGRHISPKYDAEDLHSGKCIYSTQITRKDEGSWVCNMGVANQYEGDLREIISIKVSDMQIIAESKVYKATLGSSVTLTCRSVPYNKTLGYCRFVRPDGRGIGSTNLPENVTILSRYASSEIYLTTGNCSLEIKSVTVEDFGQWKCAAIIQGASEEIYDLLSLSANSDSTITAAGISGIAVGVAVLIAVLLAGTYFIMKRKRRSVQWRTTMNELQSSARTSDAASSDSSNDIFVPVVTNEAGRSDDQEQSHRKYS